MAWTDMTQALTTPQVVPAWRYLYPLVRFLQKPANPAAISGGFTRRGRARTGVRRQCRRR